MNNLNYATNLNRLKLLKGVSLNKNIILAAGGTGGHIYPAIAVAKALESINENVKVNFWGATKGLENTIIPKYNYPLHRVKMGRLNHNVSKFERIFTLFLLPVAIVKAIYIILKLKPKFVMGFGGHASAPILLAASFLNIPRYIWEPNALPGLANRKLSSFMDMAFVVFEKSKKHMKCETLDLGLPIRKEVEQKVDKVVDSYFNILVYGGSQGSMAINKIILEMIQNELLPPDVRILLQTGVKNLSQVKQMCGDETEQLKLIDYIHDMPRKYAWANLAIARAGTGTISEFASVGLPSILIPLPTSSEYHQFDNAKSLADENAAILIEQKEASSARLAEEILKLKNNKQSLIQMSQNIKSFHQPNSAEKIAKYLLENTFGE